MVPRKQGLIINISSFGGQTYLFNVAYGIGKAAVDRMAVDCGIELKKQNVACLSLMLGAVKTEKTSTLIGDQGEKMIKELNEQKSKIRGLLGKRLAHKLRIIPGLRFYLDTSMDKAMRIARLLNGLEESSSKESMLIN